MTATLSEQDLYLFNEGSHLDLADRLGAHIEERDGWPGTSFAVWAPNAEYVSVVGDFNGWNQRAAPLEPQGGSGIWGGFVREVGQGARYKFHIRSRHNGHRVNKADPLAFHAETLAGNGLDRLASRLRLGRRRLDGGTRREKQR